jgi:hypothetical protein
MDIEKIVQDIFERNIGLNQEMLYKAITSENVKDCIRDALKLHLSDVRNSVCRTFCMNGKTTSATKCMFCGREKWEHEAN